MRDVLHSLTTARQEYVFLDVAFRRAGGSQVSTEWVAFPQADFCFSGVVRRSPPRRITQGFIGKTGGSQRAESSCDIGFSNDIAVKKSNLSLANRSDGLVDQGVVVLRYDGCGTLNLDAPAAGCTGHR